MSEDEGGRIKAFLMSLFEIGWFYKLLSGDIGITQFIIRDIPVVGWFYSLAFGMPDEEEDDENDSKDRGKPMTDGGVNRRPNNRQGVYDPVQKLDDQTIDLPISGKIIKKIGKIGLSLGILAAVIIGGLYTIGGGYGGLLDDMFGSYTSGLDDIAGTATYKVGQAYNTITCFGNVGCIREWQLNRTRRPGSEDVDETYRLRVENLRIYGSEVGVDVGYQQPEAEIPVSFLLKNTRHGLKGINAENVYYKVKIRDERLVGGTDRCSTDWIELDKYGSADAPEGFESNTLLPGEGVEPLGYSESQDAVLSLKECGLLQPSAGSSVDFVLQIQYDYSSQSTLQVQAMSREHRRSEEIPIEFKRSETADTPVETFIHTRSPILFQDTGESRTGIPFRTRIGVQTDERNIQYRIDPEAFELQDSSRTTAIEGTCDGLTRTEEDTYKLQTGEDSATERINQRQESDWFSKRSQPVPVSCRFKIEEDDLPNISPTGETLTMNADVKYKVLQEEQRETFKVSNSLCTDYNCPMLISLTAEDLTPSFVQSRLEKMSPTNNENYWKKEYALCNRPFDNQNGCSVIPSFEPADRSKEPLNDNPIPSNTLALKIDTPVFNKGTNFVSCRVREGDSIPSLPRYIGVTEEELERAFTNRNEAITYDNGRWRLIDNLDDSQKLTSNCQA